MRCQSRGFTLIEILFVLAIVAVMTALGLTFYQQTTRSSKIDKTALQMQQILQAASNYYVATNNQWPADGDATFIADYLPVFASKSATGIPEDPWGDTYSWSASTDNNTFQVQMTPPPQSKTVGKDTQLLAQRIAANAPNATVATAAPYTVTAEVTAPGLSAASVGENGTLFAGAGLVTSGGYVGFNCPGDMAPQLYASISNFQVQSIAVTGPKPIGYIHVTNTKQGDNSECSGSPQNCYQVNVSIDYVDSKGNATSIVDTSALPKASWTAVCVKQSPKQVVLL